MNRPTAYVINLDRRRDRWDRVQKLWSPFFNLKRFSAIDRLEDGALGCKISHLAVASRGLMQSEGVLVLEDDAEPTEWFEKIGMEIIDWASSNVDKWDYINCGPFLDLSPIQMRTATLRPCASGRLVHADYSHNTHMVLYNEASWKLLAASLLSETPVDMFLGNNSRKQLVPSRLLAKQFLSPSNVNKPFWDANQLYALSEQMLEAAVPNLPVDLQRSEAHSA